jgi:hypothetical protein
MKRRALTLSKVVSSPIGANFKRRGRILGSWRPPNSPARPVRNGQAHAWRHRLHRIDAVFSFNNYSRQSALSASVGNDVGHKMRRSNCHLINDGLPGGEVAKFEQQG